MDKYKFIFVILLFLVLACENNSSDQLYVISSIDEYKDQIKTDSQMKLVDLVDLIPNIKLDIRYATENNFTGEVIYNLPKAYLRKPVANALKLAQDSLRFYKLGFKVFDAYRPYQATVKFFEVYPDTNFVANPKYGSRHNRGCAVDVSLVCLDTGKEILMPTDYDEFSEKAHPEYKNLQHDAIENRDFLLGVMNHFGFTVYPTEWWHFDYVGWEEYPLMDLSFEQLESSKDVIK
jgi:zinc D-Ala-D-Ala dipeptidase